MDENTVLKEEGAPRSSLLYSRPRLAFWTESLAVGKKEFVQDIQAQLVVSAMSRVVIDEAERHMLKEPPASYTGYLGQENTPLSIENSHIWNDKVGLS